MNIGIPQMSDKDCSGRSGQKFSQVYAQLRKIATMWMSRQKESYTLQTTALVHEAWLRLSAHETRSWWDNAGKLRAAASTTMRRILIDRARLRKSLKRGGGLEQVPVEEMAAVTVAADDNILLIHEALSHLEETEPIHAKVVALKFFGGLSNREVAEEMGLTERTVERYWAHARTWLYNKILILR